MGKNYLPPALLLRTVREPCSLASHSPIQYTRGLHLASLILGRTALLEPPCTCRPQVYCAEPPITKGAGCQVSTYRLNILVC